MDKILSKSLSVNIINQLNAPPETTPVQKTLILIGFGTFVALVALTASLPLPVLHNQPTSLPPASDDAVPGSGALNKGDTAWMIMATAFAILAGPTLSYLHGNLYGRTSGFGVQVSLIVSALIAVLWIVISFSLTYAKDANGDQILGFPKYYYMFAHVGAEPDGVYTQTVPFSIFAIFELTYPIIAASLVVTAIVDRVNVYGLVFFMFVWHICLYTPVAHITWNDRGFFNTNYIEDFAGGLVVMMTAGITAISAHMYLNWIGAPAAEPRKPTDSLSALAAAWALWFLWFGVNAGKAYNAGPVAAQTIVNTIGGVTSSILLHYFWDELEGVPTSSVTLTNAILVGLVGTTPCSGYVTVGGAQVVVVITALVTRVFGKYIFKETLDDTPYSIGILYGVGGSTAFLFTALMSYEFVNAKALNGLTFGIATPIRHHTAAVLAMWICGLCANLFGLFVCDLIFPLNKNRQVETAKLGAYSPSPVGPFYAATQPAAEQPAAQQP